MAISPDVAGLLREARTRAGLTQAELAQRAGVQQSVISVYEAGRRQPSVATLASLVAATGFDLDIRLRRRPSGLAQLRGPLGRRLRRHRPAVLALAATQDVRVLGVFGSVSRGEDGADSDLDLLVDLPPSIGLLGLARLQAQLEELIGAPVDLVPAADLKPGVRSEVEQDLVPL
jgi:predicted nucleotidyltransferase/DNA-binding XRE family transcriptional regulator